MSSLNFSFKAEVVLGRAKLKSLKYHLRNNSSAGRSNNRNETYEEEIQIRTQVLGRKENCESSTYCHEEEELARERDISFLKTHLGN